MVKAMKAKARAIAQFLAISAAVGYFVSSQVPITGARAKRSPEDLRTFQEYAADVNDVVTALRKEGLLAKDIFKGSGEVRSPGGQRISVVADFKKDPNSIYIPQMTREMNKGKASKFASITSHWAINSFLEQNPKAVSEKLMQRINALNKHYDQEIEPIFRKFDRKRAASRKRRTIAFGTVMGALAGTLVASKDRAKRKKKLIKRQRR